MLKKILIVIVTIVALVFSGVAWLRSILPNKSQFVAVKQSQVADLPYVTQNVPEYRGKILAVVTSANKKTDGTDTGYEHTELARAYWVFVANGFEVDIASPKGGLAPVVVDGDDMGAFDYAFLNDAGTQEKVANTLALADVSAQDYEAVYFVGGKGSMYDFPDNPDVQRITKTLYQQGKVVSAVCHGPAALVNVKLDDGSWLVENKAVSGFTNVEELTLIPDAKEIFPFLLQNKLTNRGANYQEGMPYLEQVSHDGKLITGQNPWSVWKMAELVVTELGYEPKPRERTREEYAVDLLKIYEQHGLDKARSLLEQNPKSYQELFIIMHSLVAFMQLELGKGIDLIRLANAQKNMIESMS